MTTPDWSRRFADYVDRKARDARSASLSPFETEIDRPEEADVEIGNAWTRLLYDGPFRLSAGSDAMLPQASLVFVQSRNGNTVADDPETLGGGATDKHLIYEGLSRVAADAVLAGAETARGTDVVFSTWHPEIVRLREELGLPRHPVQIVATLGGFPCDAMLLCNVPDVPMVVVTTAGGQRAMARDLAERPWATAIVMPEPSAWRFAFAELRRMGIRRISVVGGHTLARSIVAAAVIDDLYLTTSAIDAGEPHTPLFDAPVRARLLARKHGTGPDRGVRFERYRF